MSYNYLPKPPRVWSRVENSIVYENSNNINYNNVYVPLSNQYITQAQANYQTQLYNKGNVLHYKENAQCLTKAQKYSQIVKGFGPNRTKTFATQTQMYSNPNTHRYKRIYKDMYLDPYKNNTIINIEVNTPNNLAGPFEYRTSPDFCADNDIVDGGHLVAGQYVIRCTNYVYKTTTNNQVICSPASSSGVPGNQILCWNKKLQTFYPKNRYIMNNSTDKWPVGYKEFVSAVTLTPPILSGNKTGINQITLSWINPENIYPVSEWIVYQNDILRDIISNIPETNTFIINGLSAGTYSYFIVAKNNNIYSKTSNIVNITI